MGNLRSSTYKGQDAVEAHFGPRFIRLWTTHTESLGIDIGLDHEGMYGKHTYYFTPTFKEDAAELARFILKWAEGEENG